MKSISKEVERAEKLVHSNLIAEIGLASFEKLMEDKEYRDIVDRTVLQEAGVLIPEGFYE